MGISSFHLMRCACLTLALGGLSMAAERANFAGTWTLDTAQSTGSIPEYSSMSVGQTSRWFRSAELDKDGRTERTVENECKIDGRFHPVSGGDGGSVQCKWEGPALLTEKHWNNAQNRRVTRSTIAPNGNLIQEIKSTGPDGNKETHLVWKRQG